MCLPTWLFPTPISIMFLFHCLSAQILAKEYQWHRTICCNVEILIMQKVITKNTYLVSYAKTHSEILKLILLLLDFDDTAC